MTGARYRELGDRRTIHVHRRTGLGGEVLYKIFRGSQCFDGRLGEQFIQEKSWHTEEEAQSFLDRLAKVRGWKPVTK